MGNNTLREELFVPVPGFPNYAVSNYGTVCNVKRGTDLKHHIDPGGFSSVALFRDGKRQDFGVHRLVAQAFFTDFDPNIVVKHKNGDKQDNSVLNLTLGERLHVRVRIVETGQEFDSITACAEAIGGLSTGVWQVLNGYVEANGTKHLSYLGYTFEVVDRPVK